MKRAALLLVTALVVVPSAAGAKFSFTLVTSSPVTVPKITLNGDDQDATFAVVTEVAYTGGKNTAGWQVSGSATAPTSGIRALPPLRVIDGSFACVKACKADPSPAGISYPITLSTTAQEIYNADPNTGRGTYDITNTFQVSAPASTFPGAYASIVTITASAGP